MTDANSTTTRLLTLLNVSATKAGKRKWSAADEFPAEKLNKRKIARLMTMAESEESQEMPAPAEVMIDTPAEPMVVDSPEVEAEDEGAFARSILDMISYFLYIRCVGCVREAFRPYTFAAFRVIESSCGSPGMVDIKENLRKARSCSGTGARGLATGNLVGHSREFV